MSAGSAKDDAASGLDAPFWAGLADGAVRLPACPRCARWVWPAEPLCSHCHHDVLDWRDVEPVGTVYSWTRTWYPFVDVRADDLPYVVVLVELPNAGGARILGTYAGDAADELVIGETLHGVISAPSPSTFELPALTWARPSA